MTTKDDWKTLEENQDTSIQRKGATLVDEFFSTFTAEDTDEVTTTRVLYYLTDIQVRDFALGILGKYGEERTLAALNHLLNNAATDTPYINAPAALLAQYEYELGRTGDAFLTLTNAQPSYSLAKLLSRVFQVGWDPKSFARMREELHPKVVAGIFGEEA
jgi:Domain of unknown function (DUF4192)